MVRAEGAPGSCSQPAPLASPNVTGVELAIHGITHRAWMSHEVERALDPAAVWC
jgi:hypothetical protein